MYSVSSNTWLTGTLEAVSPITIHAHSQCTSAGNIIPALLVIIWSSHSPATPFRSPPDFFHWHMRLTPASKSSLQPYWGHHSNLQLPHHTVFFMPLCFRNAILPAWNDLLSYLVISYSNKCFLPCEVSGSWIPWISNFRTWAHAPAVIFLIPICLFVKNQAHSRHLIHICWMD